MYNINFEESPYMKEQYKQGAVLPDMYNKDSWPSHQ